MALAIACVAACFEAETAMEGPVGGAIGSDDWPLAGPDTVLVADPTATEMGARVFGDFGTDGS